MIKTKPHWKAPHLVASVIYAWAGLKEVFRRERNFRSQCGVLVFMTAAGIFFRFQRWEWAVVVLSAGLMMAVETLNTAIEHMMDDACQGQMTPHVKLVKDISAGACLIVAICVAILGLMILIPHILKLG